jgi:hypothetical protein
MISEAAVMVLSMALTGGGPKVFDDAQVSKLFGASVGQRNIGSSTPWVDVTRQVGHTHSLWLEKVSENRWEMRGAM